MSPGLTRGTAPRPQAAGAAPGAGLTATVRSALLAVSFALLLRRPRSAPMPPSRPRPARLGARRQLTAGAGPGLVTGLLVAAYVLGACGVALALLRAPPAALVLASPRWCSAPLALLTAPFGSADHTNYLAYGRILVQGGDP